MSMKICPHCGKPIENNSRLEQAAKALRDIGLYVDVDARKDGENYVLGWNNSGEANVDLSGGIMQCPNGAVEISTDGFSYWFRPDQVVDSNALNNFLINRGFSFDPETGWDKEMSFLQQEDE